MIRDSAAESDESVQNEPAERDQRREQAKILEIFGTIDIDPDYDYKQWRRS